MQPHEFAIVIVVLVVVFAVAFVIDRKRQQARLRDDLAEQRRSANGSRGRPGADKH